MATRAEAGFTLIELLVALAIVATIGSLAVLGFDGRGGSRDVEIEARRLASRLRLAADETLLAGRTLAFQADPGGYAFLERNPAGGGWMPAKAGVLAEPHRLRADVRIEVGSPGPTTIAVDGAGEPIEATLTRKSTTWKVVFDGVDVDASAGAE